MMPNGSVLIRCGSCGTLNRVPVEKRTAHAVCGRCKATLGFPSAPIHATAESYDRQVRDWPEFLLAEFWAKWCGYCRKIEPVVNALAANRAGRLKVIKVDVDAEPALASRFSVKATPTFILYRNGLQLARLDGSPAENSELERWIDRMIG